MLRPASYQGPFWLRLQDNEVQVTWLTAGWPRQVLEVLARPDRPDVVAANELSPGARQIVEDAGLSWFDGTGAGRLSILGLIVMAPYLTDVASLEIYVQARDRAGRVVIDRIGVPEELRSAIADLQANFADPASQGVCANVEQRLANYSESDPNVTASDAMLAVEAFTAELLAPIFDRAASPRPPPGSGRTPRGCEWRRRSLRGP